jgi:hypothetical protein
MLSGDRPYEAKTIASAMMHCFNVQLGRDQIGKPKLSSDSADSPLETKPIELKTSSRMSQTQHWSPVTRQRWSIFPAETHQAGRSGQASILVNANVGLRGRIACR